MRRPGLSSLLSCLLLTSCAGLRVDTIKYEELRRGQVVFGGVSSTLQDWSQDELSRYSKIARDSIAYWRADLEVKETDWFIGRVGASQFLQANNTIRERRQLSTEDLERLGEKLTDIRYVIFARIDRDELERSSSDLEETVGSKKESYTEHVTVREITVYLEICDLKENRIAWFGALKKSVSRKRRNPHMHSGGFFRELINSAIEDKMYGAYPEPPSLDEVIVETFRSVGANLPSAPRATTSQDSAPL